MNKVIDKGFRSCRFVSTIVKHPVYSNMTAFVAWFDFSIFACMHKLKQTYDSVLKTVA